MSERDERRRRGARGSAEGDALSAPRVLDRVRKRDGRVVPFQLDKITAAISAAMEAIGAPEPAFAAEVAAVVELTLREELRASGAPSVPEIEEIQDLVERALMELGRPNVAKAYILHRDRRARIREALRVHRSDALRTPIRVREAEGVSPWSKGRLVAALIEEAELPRESAEEIAAGVERRVFASGLTRITTGLVRELVAGELLERGWTHALSSLGVIGVARHDLRGLFAGRPLDEWEVAMDGTRARAPRATSGPGANSGAGGWRASVDAGGALDTRGAVSGEVLRRYALEDVIPGGVGELHRAGDLFVEDLRAPHMALSMCLDTDLLAAGGHSVTSAQAVLDGVATLARRVTRVLVLERPAEVLSQLVRAARPGSPLGLSGWLRSLAAVARAAGIRVDLGSPGARFDAFTARLVEALADMPIGVHGEYAPALHLDGHELESLLAQHEGLDEAVERLMADGRLFTTWGEEDEAYAGPGCHRRRREPGVVSCGGAVALNLPRLARRAGAWREDLVQSGIAELVQAALEVVSSLDAFQTAHDGGRPAGFHTRRSWAITPVGLREALLVLGDGTIDPDQGARLLGLIAEAATRFVPRVSQSVVTVAPCPFFGERAARRFAWLDDRARADAGRQRALFDGTLDAERLDAPRPYTPDLRLSPVTGVASGRHEADALRTLTAGALSMAGLPALSDFSGPSSLGGSSDATPHLSAWRRFEVLRRERVGEVVLELFPTPRPTSAAPAPLRPLA